jgi:hypothetical protein
MKQKINVGFTDGKCLCIVLTEEEDKSMHSNKNMLIGEENGGLNNNFVLLIKLKILTGGNNA